ncbi:PaaI family thioesterase [Pseudonocardia xinjiangensis]|uniref:PaaI family thioesterase n=1 Tax=Pseudonocardia xinjiangensis TaxID=75289 RepID=UPI003D93B0C5
MTDLAAPGAELTLPWAGRADSHCFGCAPANPVGLGLRFRPGSDGGIVTDLCLDRRFESYPGVLHGGIVALVCDETMGNLVVLRHGTVAVTTSLRMRYVGVVAIGGRYSCHAWITGAPDGTIAGRAEVRDVHGELMATATAGYRPVPADDAGIPRTSPRGEDPT